ncbi:MAG: PaaI family thioesterase [Candidatus Dormiibacterota bacterium]
MKTEGRVSAAWEWLGLKVVAAEEGSATVEMLAQEQMANSSGNVHGGLISTLADSAMGRSVWTIKPGVRRAASFDLKLTFVAAARIGETLRATGRVVHVGRRTCVTECRVEGAGGRLIATASGTFMVSREREQ